MKIKEISKDHINNINLPKRNVNIQLVNNIKNHLGVENLKEVHMSNLLNLKVKDVDEIETGERELSLKDINIICNFYHINPDKLFDGMKNTPKNKKK